MQTYTMKLSELIKKSSVTPVYIPSADELKGNEPLISTADVNRPGLALTGFWDYFVENRIQVLGKAEYKYLDGFSQEERRKKLSAICQKKVPAMIICHDLPIYPELIEEARKNKVPVLTSKNSTNVVTAELISILSVELAPRVTRHGVLVEVYGEGLLMIGESGVGKSETAIELLKRGHRLIADDAVDIKRVSNRTLVGSSPEIIRYLIELRGIGVVDVRRLFGMGAVKETEKIDLVVQLEPWNENRQYDRLGIDTEYYEILGLRIPSVVIPIKPGRNLAMILEVAAMNNRLKRLGYSAAEELNRRLQENMGVNL